MSNLAFTMNEIKDNSRYLESLQFLCFYILQNHFTLPLKMVINKEKELPQK